MKKITLFFTGLVLFNFGINAQDIVIAGWTFPVSSAVADTGLTINLGNEITTIGGTSAIEFKNGFETKAAQATAWNNGMGLKAWVINLSTEGYNNLTISSRQQSGGNDPGPKDFKIQFSVDGGEIWEDVENGQITVENDWETSLVNNLPLQENSYDQSQLKIRWIMTSNEASGAGGDVLESGKSKIDNIFIRGDQINAIEDVFSSVKINIFPNPATNYIDVKSNGTMQNIVITDLSGKIIFQKTINTQFKRIDISDLSKGNYFITVKNTEDRKEISRLLMIR